MVAEDKEIWIDFKANVVSKITPEYKKILCTLHAKVLQPQIPRTLQL
jgi:hypothetical protein